MSPQFQGQSKGIICSPTQAHLLYHNLKDSTTHELPKCPRPRKGQIWSHQTHSSQHSLTPLSRSPKLHTQHTTHTYTQAAADTSLTPQLLDTLRCMLSRSPKLAMALSAGNLVPCLLAMLESAAPILRVKLLEIIRWA